MAIKKTKKKTSKKKVAKKKTRRKKKEEVPMLLTASRVKDFIRDSEFRMSGEFTEAFNAQVFLQLKRAIRRCAGNNRQTVKPIDAL